VKLYAHRVCQDCGRHSSETFYVSRKMLCRDCSWARQERNLHDLTEEHGEQWQTCKAAAIAHTSDPRKPQTTRRR